MDPSRPGLDGRGFDDRAVADNQVTQLDEGVVGEPDFAGPPARRQVVEQQRVRLAAHEFEIVPGLRIHHERIAEGGVRP